MCGHKFDYSLFFQTAATVCQEKDTIQKQSPLGVQFVVPVLEFGLKVLTNIL